MLVTKAAVNVLGTIVIELTFLLSAPAYSATFTTLYHFTDKADGGEPIGGVVQDASGNIYGETSIGGGVACSAKSGGQGCGTVYSLSSSGVFKVLVTFTGANGGHGNITPVLIGDTLYGATSAGGLSDDGIVFSINTDGTDFTILHAFSGADGVDPQALVAGAGGILYGVTLTGGLDNQGSLFSISKNGTFDKLHDFDLPVSGGPNSLISSEDGTLFGSTFQGGSPTSGCPQGCGTIFAFELAPQRYITLDSLPVSGTQGQRPYVGSIGPGPTLYAGANDTIFSLSRQDGYQLLANLNSYTTGSGVQSGPVYAPDGILYGVLDGSITATDGLIYSLQNGVITDLYVFGGSQDGASGSDAIAQPIFTSAGSLIGTTHESGLCDPCGTVWEYTP